MKDTNLKHVVDVVVLGLEQLSPGRQAAVGEDSSGLQQPVSVALNTRIKDQCFEMTTQMIVFHITRSSNLLQNLNMTEINVFLVNTAKNKMHLTAKIFNFIWRKYESQYFFLILIILHLVMLRFWVDFSL